MAKRSTTVSKESFFCCKCGKTTTREGFFHKFKSPLYEANGYRLPICKDCINKMYLEYLEKYKDHHLAVKRICQMFDIYFNYDCASVVAKEEPKNIITRYLQRVILTQYSGHKQKTYEDTIDEEGGFENSVEIIGESVVKSLDKEQKELIDYIETIFGVKVDYSDAKKLNYLYNDWMTKTGANSRVQEEVIKNICWDQFNIEKARATNAPTKDYEKSLLDNIMFGGWKPKDKDSNSTQMTFGKWIKRYENDKPVEDCANESYIKDLIETYYYGHLGESVGLKNSYSEKYKERMKKYSVENKNEDSSKIKDLKDKLFK